MAACFVYMVTNRADGVLYVGFTNTLPKRAYEHRHGLCGGFTKKYALTRLVWYEGHDDILEARARERRIKRWRRAWKIALIEAMNPSWRDLGPELGPE